MEHDDVIRNKQTPLKIEGEILSEAFQPYRSKHVGYLAD